MIFLIMVPPFQQLSMFYMHCMKNIAWRIKVRFGLIQLPVWFIAQHVLMRHIFHLRFLGPWVLRQNVKGAVSRYLATL